jgi:peptidoglycan/LPS O-acetylase OafA/YrhL
MKLDLHLLNPIFQPNIASGKRYFPFIQGMRGFAMLIIFIGHNYTQFLTTHVPPSGITHEWVDFYYTTAPAAVDLFFFISGYLSYASLIKRPIPFFSYLGRRVQRLYPPYFAIFALYVALSFLFPTFSKIPDGASQATIYLLQNMLLLPGVFNIPPLISVAWIMSYELFWILALPLILSGLRLRAWQPRQRLLLWIGLALTALLLYSQLGGPIRLIMFIAGFITYDLLTMGYHKPLPQGSGLAIIPIMCTLIVLTPINLVGMSWRMLIIFLSLIPLFLDCFLSPEGPTARLFSWKPFVWWGNISYSYFLTHGLVTKVAGVLVIAFLPPTQGWRDVLIIWGLPLVTFIPTILFALLLYFGVELRFSFASKPQRSTQPEQPIVSATDGPL